MDVICLGAIVAYEAQAMELWLERNEFTAVLNHFTFSRKSVQRFLGVVQGIGNPVTFEFVKINVARMKVLVDAFCGETRKFFKAHQRAFDRNTGRGWTVMMGILFLSFICKSVSGVK